jgi:hypothetical protein
MEQLKLLLVYCQDSGVTNAGYYNRFKTRVDVAEHTGVSFDNPVLWDWKYQELYSIGYDSLLDSTKEVRSRRMSSRHSWHNYSSSIAMIRNIASLRRLWLMIMRKETERRFPAADMQLLCF